MVELGPLGKGQRLWGRSALGLRAAGCSSPSLGVGATLGQAPPRPRRDPAPRKRHTDLPLAKSK